MSEKGWGRVEAMGMKRKEEPKVYEIINTCSLLVLRILSLFFSTSTFVTFHSISLHQGLANYIMAPTSGQLYDFFFLGDLQSKNGFTFSEG